MSTGGRPKPPADDRKGTVRQSGEGRKPFPSTLLDQSTPDDDQQAKPQDQAAPGVSKRTGEDRAARPPQRAVRERRDRPLENTPGRRPERSPRRESHQDRPAGRGQYPGSSRPGPHTGRDGRPARPDGRPDARRNQRDRRDSTAAPPVHDKSRQKYDRQNQPGQKAGGREVKDQPDVQRIKPEKRWFAVLFTKHPPPESVRLVTGAAPGERVSLIFDPLRFAEEQQSLFGVVHGAEGVFTPDAQLDVYRGRFGGKPSEQLRLLGHVAPDVLNWPRARWAGFTKGAATALAEMSTAAGAAQPMLCWLALQLAMYGFVQRKDAAMAAQAYGPVTLAPQGPVIPVGSLLVWRDYLSRQCDELDGRLRELQRRNPFINGATREQVQRWLKLEQPELAGRILREFCERSGLRVGRTLLGPVVRLGKLHEAVAPRDFSTAQTILRRVHEDQLTNKHALQTAYPAQQHLAAWLLDAGMLVDCGGYYFTREDLLHALDLLHVKKANIATAGVRDIKDVLEYPRRKAEALRAFIVQHFGTGGEADTAPHGAGR